MAQRKSLTLADHQATGAALRRMHEELVSIGVLVGNAYNREIHRKADKVLGALRDLRSVLDDRLFKEHRERPTNVLTEVYFGSPPPDVPPSAAEAAPDPEVSDLV